MIVDLDWDDDAHVCVCRPVTAWHATRSIGAASSSHQKDYLLYRYTDDTASKSNEPDSLNALKSPGGYR